MSARGDYDRYIQIMNEMDSAIGRSAGLRLSYDSFLSFDAEGAIVDRAQFMQLVEEQYTEHCMATDHNWREQVQRAEREGVRVPLRRIVPWYCWPDLKDRIDQAIALRDAKKKDTENLAIRAAFRRAGGRIRIRRRRVLTLV